MKLYKLINGKLSVNSYIIGDDNNESCYIIDPGENPQQILIKATEFKKVLGILLTHGHFDHCSGADIVADKFNCPIYMNLLDTPQIDGTYASRMGPFHYEIKHNVLDIFTLKDPNVIIYETPGHTKGSVSYYFKNENILFTGDALFKGSIGRTDLPGGSYKDTYETLKLFKSLKDDIKVYPGHEEDTTIGEEKHFNTYLIG